MIDVLPLRVATSLSFALLAHSCGIFMLGVEVRTRPKPARGLLGDVALAPVARLCPYAVVGLLLPCCIAIIGRAEGGLWHAVFIFTLTLAPSLVASLVISSLAILINGLMARVEGRRWRPLAAFLPPSAVSLYITFDTIWKLLLLLPDVLTPVVSLFILLFSVNGAIEPAGP